jgi:hypothetical protein
MTTRRKWLLGSIGFMLAVLAVAGYTFETRYEMGEVSFPWQKSRRRLIAARRMFDPHKSLQGGGGRFMKFLINDDDDERREARARKNRSMCDRLTTAWTDYFVRCIEPKGDERERVRAEMQDLVTHAVPETVWVCSELQAPNEGPPGEQFDSCVAFFASGTCDILDYEWMELAVSTHDVRVKRPTKPQPHMEACPLLFGQ